MTQANIIEKCKKNDRSAQLKLYNQYCQGMYVVTRRYVRDPDDAEDVMQEAFINAFHKIEQYNGHVAFGAWLKKIVINKALDHIKSRQIEVVELNEEIYDIQDNEEQWKVDPKITIAQVKQAIQALSEKYQYVLQMYLIDGFDHVEIAQILNIPATTCRSRLMRGKNKLQEYLLNEMNYEQ